MLLKKDIEFHECIFKAANNKKLEKMINTLWEQVQRFRITYVSDSNASLSLIDEHQSILNAIKEGNIADSKKCKKPFSKNASIKTSIKIFF